ncbi:unnamed protein product [Ambrosiozyma monospora]|uniref:Unnamed protein product n=1 Tax=Ambrosiozyma monospora TaxID=43982 RepID=A0ACB5UDE4_AMBMO|nr:unnamed protein product [Ambrosiozyma monospora]
MGRLERLERMMDQLIGDDDGPVGETGEDSEDGAVDGPVGEVFGPVGETGEDSDDGTVEEPDGPDGETGVDDGPVGETGDDSEDGTVDEPDEMDEGAVDECGIEDDPEAEQTPEKFSIWYTSSPIVNSEPLVSVTVTFKVAV